MMAWRRPGEILVPGVGHVVAEYPAACQNGLTARGPGDPPNKLPDRE